MHNHNESASALLQDKLSAEENKVNALKLQHSKNVDEIHRLDQRVEMEHVQQQKLESELRKARNHIIELEETFVTGKVVQQKNSGINSPRHTPASDVVSEALISNGVTLAKDLQTSGGSLDGTYTKRLFAEKHEEVEMHKSKVGARKNNDVCVSLVPFPIITLILYLTFIHYYQIKSRSRTYRRELIRSTCYIVYLAWLGSACSRREIHANLISWNVSIYW